MQQQIRTFQGNNKTITAGTSNDIDIETGIYDLEFSTVQIDFTHGGVTANAILCQRKEYLLGLTQCTIQVDNQQRMDAENLSSLQQFMNYNSIKNRLKTMEGVGDGFIEAQFQDIITQEMIVKSATKHTANFKFKDFFPGFNERYLVVRQNAKIHLTVNSLTSVLLETLATGVYQVKNANSCEMFLNLKQVKNIPMEQMEGQPKSKIQSKTRNATQMYDTILLNPDEISLFTGFLIQDSAQTAITNGKPTEGIQNVIVTKDDYDIINAEDQQTSLAQANLYKKQNDINKLTVLLDHPTQGQSIQYYINFTGANQITIVNHKQIAY